MTLLVPGRMGQGNGKEDPQFGLFGAAYLTKASINRWGLRYYHFTISDEPVVPSIEYKWLQAIFGDDVLERVKENEFDFTVGNLPDTAQTVSDLQTNAHAFFLQVDSRVDVRKQWTGLYGADHVIQLPDGTRHLHYVKAVIIGLTEGVLDLGSAPDFLTDHGLDEATAREIVRSVAHIPLAAQTLSENFGKIPLAGSVFREKTDLWPIDPKEVGEESGVITDIMKEGHHWPDGPAWL
jgi:hypothetical protein